MPALADWPGFVGAWMERVRTDRVLVRLGTRSCVTFAVRCGHERVWVRMRDGGVADHGLGDGEPCPADFELVATPDVWQRFWSCVPAAPYHSVYALAMRVPDFRVEGAELSLAQHAHVVGRVLALGRRPRASEGALPPDDLEGVAGRYVGLELSDGASRIYVEETGSGRDLLLLHTAGSDSRQYHGLLADRRLRDEWHVVAFDLPCHGRSTPPADLAGEGEWCLTTDRYVETIRGVVAALGLRRPVVLGCSMGGLICLELAWRHPDEFAGVIACEASAQVVGRKVAWAKDPRVNQSLFVPEWIDGLMGPTAPAGRRAEVRWAYSQGAFGVFSGDIEFYSGDWDARERVATIDTSRCPVHMLTGEYDYSCTPEMSRRTAKAIPGATFQEMPGLGHFPMAEDPERFLGYLRPLLASLSPHEAA